MYLKGVEYEGFVKALEYLATVLDKDQMEVFASLLFGNGNGDKRKAFYEHLDVVR